MATTLLDKVKQIMYGDAPELMDLVTKQMYGYDSKSTATGKKPDTIDLTPKLPDTMGFTQEHVAFTFGRFSVPSTGHSRLIERVIEEAGEGPHRIFASHSQDRLRNPLGYDIKRAFMESCWPTATIYEGKDVRTFFGAIQRLEEEGFKSATLVVGQDRYASFMELLERYQHEYSLTIGVVAVDRTDDDVSSTKMREAVLKEDFETFKSMVPVSSDENLAEVMYAEVKENLDPPKKTLKEQVQDIMKNRVPTPGGEKEPGGPLGMDSDLKDNTLDPKGLRRRKTKKRFLQIQDEA